MSCSCTSPEIGLFLCVIDREISQQYILKSADRKHLEGESPLKDFEDFEERGWVPPCRNPIRVWVFNNIFFSFELTPCSD